MVINTSMENINGVAGVSEADLTSSHCPLRRVEDIKTTVSITIDGAPIVDFAVSNTCLSKSTATK